MNAATGVGSRYGASTIQTPVLDDVTVTYFLPSSQVLLTEND